jgi:trk system potassium uptake protein TrkH
MAILTIQQLPTIDVFFETVSAIGTVGLSTGITRSLLPLSKVIIIFLMFCGRIGSITLVASLASVKKEVPKTRNLEEKIIIG